MERTVKDLPTRAKEQITSCGRSVLHYFSEGDDSVRVGESFTGGGGGVDTLYARVYCPGEQYKGGQYIPRLPQ